MWSRTARFANVYASATLDALSVLLWLTAWAAVASYVSAGKNKGKNTKASGCDNFGLGSAAKCKISEALRRHVLHLDPSRHALQTHGRDASARETSQ
jgi:hypothetical protein